MSRASELLEQSSSIHRHPARGFALRELVWTLANRRAHAALVRIFRYEVGWKFPCCPSSLCPKMMLGTSPVVSSCREPVVVASCRFRRLNSLRRFPAQCIAASLISLQVHYYIRILFALADLLFEVFAIGKLESLWRGPEGTGIPPSDRNDSGVVIGVVVANARRRWRQRRWRRFLRGG